jgi:NDP-sugar pyrophosphorylase family protein
MISQAVILAAGHGAGVGSLLKDRPKAMLPILGKPLVVRVMDRMRDAGVRRFIVVVGEQEGEVAAYLNTSWAPDVKIQIALQPSALGMVDALKRAEHLITEPFLLASADLLIPPTHIPALLRRFEDSRSDVTLTVSEQGEPNSPVVLQEGGRVTRVSTGISRSRHSLLPLPLYACSRRILQYIGQQSALQNGLQNALQNGLQNGRSDMANALEAMIANGSTITAIQPEWSLRMSSELDLLTVNKRLLREDRDTHILSEIPASVTITPPVRIDPRVSIGQDAKIGPNVYLESGAQIGANAVVWDSVVLRNGVVNDNEVLHNQIVTRYSRVSAGLEIG